MKAIRPAIIFLAAFLGCQPDLARSSGALEIRWLGVSPSADALRATVSQGEASYQLEAPKVVAANRLSIESVPSGSVTVLGEALSAGQIIQTRLGSGEVPADGIGVVVLDLGNEGVDDGNKPSVEVGGQAIIAAQKSEGGGTLSVANTLDGALVDLFESATSSLGRPITRLTISRASVTITTGDHFDDGLAALWSGPLQVAIVPAGMAAITIGSGAVDSSTSLALTPSGAQLTQAQGLSSVLAATAQVRIEGAADSSGTDVFANLRVELTFVAE